MPFDCLDHYYPSRPHFQNATPSTKKDCWCENQESEQSFQIDRQTYGLSLLNRLFHLSLFLLHHDSSGTDPQHILPSNLFNGMVFQHYLAVLTRSDPFHFRACNYSNE